MKRLFIIHGWGGKPSEGWIKWINKEISSKGIKVFALQMPNTEKPKIGPWVSYLKSQVGKCDEETYFMGHSIGCQTILRYLETISENEKAGGAVFVAGWFFLKGLEEKEEIEIAKPWLETKIDTAKVKKMLNKSIAFFSDDDPCVSLSDSKIFKEKLGSEIIIEKNKGHYEVSKMPLLYDKLSKLMGI